VGWLFVGVAVSMGPILVLLLGPPKGLARRWLRRWGVPHPLPDQIAAAGRYLRRRRLLYLVFGVLLPGAVVLAGAALGVRVGVPARPAAGTVPGPARRAVGPA